MRLFRFFRLCLAAAGRWGGGVGWGGVGRLEMSAWYVSRRTLYDGSTVGKMQGAVA